MSWSLVPMSVRDFGYFERQKDLFSDWLRFFDDDWRVMKMEDSRKRFNKELDRIRKEMHKMDIQPIMLDVERPFVTDPEGNRKLSLRFDCGKFKPEEIQVKVQDKVLRVHAKHIEDKPGRKVDKEFTREFTLPDNVDPKSLESHLSKDGVLQIEAPAPPSVEAPKEHLIPIERLQSKDTPDTEDKANGQKADGDKADGEPAPKKAKKGDKQKEVKQKAEKEKLEKETAEKEKEEEEQVEKEKAEKEKHARKPPAKRRAR